VAKWHPDIGVLHELVKSEFMALPYDIRRSMNNEKILAEM